MYSPLPSSRCSGGHSYNVLPVCQAVAYWHEAVQVEKTGHVQVHIWKLSDCKTSSERITALSVVHALGLARHLTFVRLSKPMSGVATCKLWSCTSSQVLITIYCVPFWITFTDCRIQYPLCTCRRYSQPFLIISFSPSFLYIHVHCQFISHTSALFDISDGQMIE